jgi:hypothetical protein
MTPDEAGASGDENSLLQMHAANLFPSYRRSGESTSPGGQN